MKISSTKKAAILATVLSGFVLGSSAEAAKLGVVTASDYTTSHMGALEGSFINSDDIYSVKSVITGLNRDPAVYNTVDPVTGKSSLFIRQYTYSTVNLQNSYAFDAQGDWSNRVAGNTSDATNAHDVARYKDFVYVASYDEGTIGVAKITDSVISDQTAFTRDLKKDLELYDDVVFADKNASLHGEGVVIIDDNLYVIANVNPKGGYAPYDPSYLIKYVIKEDGRLSYDGYTTMGKNTDTVALNVYNNYMLSTAIGGYQYYGAENSNAETSIDVVTLDPVSKRFTDTRQINLPENLYTVRNGEKIPKSEFRSLKVMPNGTAYVMTYNIGRAGKNVDVTVYQTTVSNLLSSQPQNWKEVYHEAAAPGWFGRLDAEYNTKRLWVQVGNKLNIYTDGATTPLSFGTDSFAANKMYEELYTWDIISTDVIPEGNLVKLQLAVDEDKANPKANVWKDVVGNVTKIENQYKNIEDKDNLINLGTNIEGNLANNVLAGIYSEGYATNVKASEGLQIQVENNIASPVGIFAGNGGTITFTSGNNDLNIITKTMDGGNTLTNAIWLDPSKTGGESITITAGNTNLTMEGGYGGNGVAIQKTDRWGENSKESTKGGTITINGDLSIKGVDNETWGIEGNPTNVLSRFNNAGILVDVNNSTVTVNGNVDMDVYGNGVTVNAEDAMVTIAKGGSITVPTGTDYGYYALAAYDGTISMNADGSANDVKIDGDLFALKGATINLGLATGDSYINGAIDNGGTVNLTLKNGATWTNVANNTRYEQDNEDIGSNTFSRVNTLIGGNSLNQAGIIRQNADSKDIVISNLSGAIKVDYTSHADANATEILGGSVTINKAEANSQIAMIATNQKGISTRDITAVDAVLEALANKLYYNGNASNLSAVAVGLSEGLTSSAVTRTANINFNGTNGQGSLIGAGDAGTGNDGQINVNAPVHPGKDDTLNPNGQWIDDATYPNGLIYDANNTAGNISGSGTVQIQNVGTGIYVTDGKSGSVSASGDINIVTKNDAQSTNAIWLNPTTGSESLNLSLTGNMQKLNITMLGDNGGNAIAITKSDANETSATGGQINIGTMNVGTDLYIKGEANNEWGVGYNTDSTDARTNSSGILVDVENATFNLMNGSAFMDICGNGVTVDANGAKAIIAASSAFNSENTGIFKWYKDNGYDLSTMGYKTGSKILVPKGSEARKYYSLAAYEGDIYFDVNPTYKGMYLEYSVQQYNTGENKYKQYTGYGIREYGKIDGDMYLGGANAHIDAGFRGEDAYFNGAVINNGGIANLCLLDGATWTNESTNGDYGITSHITNLRGDVIIYSGRNNGFNIANEQGDVAGKIVQTANSGDIVIDNYSGNTMVYYGYNSKQPYKFEGGDVTIKSAAAGSKITLHTHYSDAINWGNLEYVLANLANKLYYTGAISTENGGSGENNLSASLRIGEGMTASALDVDILKKAEILGADGKLNPEIDNVEWNNSNKTFNAGIVFDSETGKGGIKEIPKDGSGAEDIITQLPDGYIVPDGFQNETTGVYTEPIYGVFGKDLPWVATGIYKVIDSEITYDFKSDVSFDINNKRVDAGPYHKDISAVIIASGDIMDPNTVYKTVVNLNGNDLTIKNDSTELGSGASISAIEGGIVEINNPGDINIYENGCGPTAGIFANGGGEVYINNAETGSVVTIHTTAGPEGSSYGVSGAGIKTMNGVCDARSKIVITGKVDIVADLDKCNNEGLSAVASTIEIGGGTIKAINGAWAAIRAYGEFVSENAAIVNVNVLKDNAGNITGAGNYKDTIIEGDFVTNGGMGTKGYITVGLNGKGSHWIGNYGDNRGYGVTKGQEGNVTLYMKDGAYWTGFSDGEMNVTMEGKGTTWYGFNVAEREPDAVGNTNGGLYLTLADGALWQNAITKEQTINNVIMDSKVYSFVGSGGYIDMTGNKTFIGKNEANHAEGSNGVSNKNTHIVENLTPQETGNLVITNYSGDTTVIYRRDANNITNVLGGTTTIKNATLGSKITLSTDGYGMTNNQVAETLDNLAEKLYYTAYVNGERNLKGYVQIAEGLTTESVGKHVGSIDYNSSTGQGSLNKDSLGFDVTPPSDDEEDDNTQGGGNEGGTGGTTPEKPEDKPVEPEKPVEPDKPPVEIGAPITGDNLENNEAFKNEAGNTIVKVDNEKGETVIDFGKLDVDKDGKEKPEHEHVGHVKIEPEKTSENASLISNAGVERQHYVLELDGKDLSLVGGTTGENKEAKGIEAVNGTVTIKKAGDVLIEATAENGKAHAIYASGTGNDVVIERDEDNKDAKITMVAKDNDKSAAVLHADKGANVKIDGIVDITQTNGKEAIAVGEGSKVEIAGGVIGGKAEEGKDNVAIKVIEGGKIKINEAGEDHDVVIKGKIILGAAKPVEENQAQPVMMKMSARRMVVPDDKSSVIMTTQGSKLEDDVHYDNNGDNDFYAAFTYGASWTGNSTGGVDLNVLLEDGGAWTGYHEDEKGNTLTMEINSGAIWTNTAKENDATTINSLSGNGGYIQMSDKTGTHLNVEQYSGNTTIMYNHDEKTPTNILGGDVTIKAVTAGSNITLHTDSIGTSKQEEVKKVLDALAQKLTYINHTDGNLTGTVQILEGMTTSSAMRKGEIVFGTDGKGNLNTSKDIVVENTYTGDYIYGDSETAMMKGAKSAMASTVMMWRSESNDLLQRMGDVRLATEESGVWAKYYGGKYEMDAQNTNFSTNYKAYQVGYDKAVGNGWNVGVAVSHNEGDSRYDRGGEGEMTVTSLSVYGNKDYGDGRYLGLILKGSQLKNEYEVFNNDGYKLEGDFKTWGTSISAEYGKRIEKGNGFYFDPSVELTVGHVQGKDYTATSDMLAAYGKTATMQVEQDDFNSIIGRVGFGIGQRTDKASYYAKLALAHEFGGDFDTHYTAEETKGTSISFGDTWYEMQLGGTAKLSDNSLLYATYERSFGGDVTEKWRVDAGLRVTF
ncbi:MAG: autotransporter outer membrane beta-barrel domain-containing protein [Phascolarctobacterium sp.]|nr:autotransporter outer membrane beta-barrel domain-containing protein [Phascolarctobacterium sp.]